MFLAFCHYHLETMYMKGLYKVINSIYRPSDCSWMLIALTILSSRQKRFSSKVSREVNRSTLGSSRARRHGWRCIQVSFISVLVWHLFFSLTLTIDHWLRHHDELLIFLSVIIIIIIIMESIYIALFHVFVLKALWHSLLPR